MSRHAHIPHLKTIEEFYRMLRIGEPNGEHFSIMRIEDQPETKLSEMPLFRCNFYRLVFLTSPGVAWSLPDQKFSNSINNIYFSHPGKLESWVINQKIYGYLVCFTEDFIGLDSLHTAFEKKYPFFQLNSPSILNLQDSNAKGIKSILEKMLLEMSSIHTDKKEMLKHLLLQYLIETRRAYIQQHGQQTGDISNSLAILNSFKKEVSTYFEL